MFGTFFFIIFFSNLSISLYFSYLSVDIFFGYFYLPACFFSLYTLYIEKRAKAGRSKASRMQKQSKQDEGAKQAGCRSGASRMQEQNSYYCCILLAACLHPAYMKQAGRRTRCNTPVARRGVFFAIGMLFQPCNICFSTEYEDFKTRHKNRATICTPPY